MGRTRHAAELVGHFLGWAWFLLVFGGGIVYAAVQLGGFWWVALVFPALVLLGSLRYR